MIPLIEKYFPDLTPLQKSQFKQLGPLYQYWNQKINVISRQDIENIYEHHVLHSLCIAKFIDFQPGTSVLDMGTGGGFPGIPLAILFPEVQFHLVDSIDKKTKVVDAIYRALALRNVSVQQMRAEDLKEKYDFIINRAVADLMILYDWSINLIRRGLSFNDIPNGMISLKGGFLDMELAPFKDMVYRFPINEFFNEPYFTDKFLLYLPMD